MHSHTPPGSAGFDRTVFFVSDGTGITAETFGHSVLTQFDLRFRQIRLPFIDTEDKAHEAVRRIDDALKIEGKRPIVFSTLVKSELSAIVRRADAMHMDLIQTFVEPLEQELGTASTHTIGRSHNIADSQDYKSRIEAINFSLAHDDGQSHKNLSSADVILVGVSRSVPVMASRMPPTMPIGSVFLIANPVGTLAMPLETSSSSSIISSRVMRPVL